MPQMPVNFSYGTVVRKVLAVYLEHDYCALDHGPFNSRINFYSEIHINCNSLQLLYHNQLQHNVYTSSDTDDGYNTWKLFE